MFTGIVEEVGEVSAIDERGQARALRVEAPLTASDLEVGGSVAVNGACLTAVEVGATGFRAEAIQETLKRTNLGGLRVGARVNLERPLRLGGRLEGHWVQGHIDTTGQLLARQADESGSLRLKIGLPAELARYLVPKGSVAIDGTSLTVGEVESNAFAIYLIPHTLTATTLGERRVGEALNIELDVLAKYVERLVGQPKAPAALTDWLAAGARSEG